MRFDGGGEGSGGGEEDGGGFKGGRYVWVQRFCVWGGGEGGGEMR